MKKRTKGLSYLFKWLARSSIFNGWQQRCSSRTKHKRHPPTNLFVAAAVVAGQPNTTTWSLNTQPRSHWHTFTRTTYRQESMDVGGDDNNDDDDVDVGDVTTRARTSRRAQLSGRNWRLLKVARETFEGGWGSAQIFFSYVRGTTHDVRPGTDSTKLQQLVSLNL